LKKKIKKGREKQKDENLYEVFHSDLFHPPIGKMMCMPPSAAKKFEKRNSSADWSHIQEASPEQKEKIFRARELNRLKNNSIYHALIWLISFTFIITGFDELHKKQQMGLFFTLGGILTSIILRPSVCYLEDGGLKRRILRVVVGIIPIVCLGVGFRVIQKNFHFMNHQSTATFMFCFGILLSIWSMWASQAFFHKIGLGKINNGDDDGTPIQERKKYS